MTPNHAYIYISTFEKLDLNLLNHSNRSYFEMYWIKDENPKHFIDNENFNIQGEWIYLVPPFRKYLFNKDGKKGYFIAFDKDLLIYEAKEFALNVFSLFRRQGNFTTVFIEESTSKSLTVILSLLQEEQNQDSGNLLLIRTLLKAFLLKLMAGSNQELISPDINEKRIYQFLLLLENHYTTEKSVKFYADKLSLSPKRLNQILKQKLGKTINQILQERLLIEAKHLLFIGEESIQGIAYKLGFQDASYFSRFFKKLTTLTPEEFKIEAKKKIAFK